MSTQNTRMIDVSSKKETTRLATARARININKDTLALVKRNSIPKGDVLAVAQGVVTWAGPREGYGVLVEVNHGNGYVTRYAHNSRVMVSAGDTVQRGQAIAVVGSTGRSTGPHVHFEIRGQGGQALDPVAWLRRRQ